MPSRPLLLGSHQPQWLLPSHRCLAPTVKVPVREPAWHRGVVETNCALANKGRRIPALDLDVRRIMGEGSYGQVFEVRNLSACVNLSLMLD